MVLQLPHRSRAHVSNESGSVMLLHRRVRVRASILAAGLLTIILTTPLLAAETAPRVISIDEFHLQDYAGQVVLVDFWASWCKPCATSLPWMSRLAATYADSGLVVVAINLDKKLASADDFLKQLDPHIVVVHDPEGELARQYDLAGMPSSFLYDRNGELQTHYVGFLPAEADAHEQAVLALLDPEATVHGH